MDFLIIFHVFLSITFLTIPFWPYKYLQYGAYIPLLLSLIWILFNGCPLSKLHDVDSSSFTKDLIRIFYPDVSDDFTEKFSTFLLLLITVISFYRLKNKV